MRAFYPGDRRPDPAAEPGLAPAPETDPGTPSVTLDVDGELFAVHPDGQGGTAYTWLSGPNPGYGFALSPTGELSLDDHRDHVRDFLAGIDPGTGHLSED